MLRGVLASLSEAAGPSVTTRSSSKLVDTPLGASLGSPGSAFGRSSAVTNGGSPAPKRAALLTSKSMGTPLAKTGVIKERPRAGSSPSSRHLLEV